MTTVSLQTLLETYIPRDRALEMAEAIVNEMDLIGFPVEEAHFTPPGLWQEIGALPQAEYVLPPNLFDINSAKGHDALDGSFLTTGNLLRLGQCVMLARRYIPSLWPGDFAPLIRGHKHLDALNEIWWLKFWRGIEVVNAGPKESENDPDFEWQIRIRDGLATGVINLEVKRRTSNINQFFKKGKPTASILNISKKFKAVEDGCANIAALTIYHPVSSEIDRRLRLWLEKQKHLHGLLIWTEGNLNTIPLKKFFKESHRWAEFLILDPEPEDLKVAGHSRGTLCEAEDAPRFLTELVNRIRNQ